MSFSHVHAAELVDEVVERRHRQLHPVYPVEPREHPGLGLEELGVPVAVQHVVLLRGKAAKQSTATLDEGWGERDK